MRRIVLIALALLAVASLLVQLVLNRPTGGFENQPAGWASSEAGDDLSGSLAAFHIAAMAVQLSANDYARVTAYASQAYMAARYRDDADGSDGQAAFFSVVRALMPDPSFHATLPKISESTASRDESSRLIQMAATDGYDLNWPPAPVRFTSPLDLGPEKQRYTWAPVTGNGPELERTWGELRTLVEHDCMVPPPPVQSLEQLIDEAKRVTTATRAMEQHPNGDGLTTLGFAYTGGYWQRAEPVRIWLQLIATAAIDAQLSTEESDRMLASAAVAFHDTMILVWRAKFGFLLAHPLAVDPDSYPYLNAQVPTYPSEHAAISRAGAEVLDQFSPRVRPRIELPGSVISAPTTRVLRDADAAVREFSTVAQMMGLAYDFDIPAGERLGSCVARGTLLGLEGAQR